MRTLQEKIEHKQMVGELLYKAQTKRSTGRTTRLLREAHSLARQKKKVLIVVDSYRTVDELASGFWYEFKLCLPSNIEIVPLGYREMFVFWETMSVFVPGRKYDAIFFDSSAIERKWIRLLVELHRFDECDI